MQSQSMKIAYNFNSNDDVSAESDKKRNSKKLDMRERGVSELIEPLRSSRPRRAKAALDQHLMPGSGDDTSHHHGEEDHYTLVNYSNYRSISQQPYIIYISVE